MISDLNVLLVVLIVAAVTILLRAIPFIIVEAISNNQYLIYIGSKMSVGVMVLLVAYTFLDVEFTKPPYGISQVTSLLIAVGLYWRLNNALISIGISLAVHLVIINGLVI